MRRSRFGASLVSKADAHGAGGGNHFAMGIDKLQVADGFRNIDSLNALATKANHLPEIVIGNEFGCFWRQNECPARDRRVRESPRAGYARARSRGPLYGRKD